MLRRDQPDVTAQFDQFACPVMCARACLHPDEAGRQIFEEGQQSLSPYAPLQNGVPVGVNAVELENRFCQIETGGCKRHDSLPKPDVTTSPISDGNDDNAEAVHAIKWAVQRARYMTLEATVRISEIPDSDYANSGTAVSVIPGQLGHG